MNANMGESKSQSSRLRSLRDSVKKITKRLSEGDADVIHKNDEHAREVDKLRVQIQSMEDESQFASVHQGRGFAQGPGSDPQRSAECHRGQGFRQSGRGRSLKRCAGRRPCARDASL